ncbi:MAG: class I SAM-dependent methyltransferase [Actinobacteria bacterium]|nr:class I SAM-dependent methyltransferase [Actinomycetota bacterium]
MSLLDISPQPRLGGVELYADALAGRPTVVRHADGTAERLPSARWTGPARGADLPLLDRAAGPVLDVGCGPGRLVAALAERGVLTLGVDPAPAAVALTRRAGGLALCRSVFDPLPGTGRWAAVLLADGNIGIGGDPLRLLRRCRDLLRPTGRVLVEVAPPGAGATSAAIRLESHDGARCGAWFPWARVAADMAPRLLTAAGLQVEEQWSAPEADRQRHFVAGRRA